ncbi:MAG: hypothetical protein DWQ01_01690 [Planctomycetota bacterium]|nr:MAG: hypothetical protein DWQ01_01690 [Planctomycetota bacterium]
MKALLNRGLLALLLASAACQSAGVDDSYLLVDADSTLPVPLTEVAQQLAQADVVFLGELHDSHGGHRFQREMLAELYQLRPDLILSLEMFERDVQESLDAWLAGALDEDEFLETARPWSNYREHYRPMVWFAKEQGLRVLAANVPRPLASRVAKEGLPSVQGEAHLPREVFVGGPEYRRRFMETLHHHPGADLDPEKAERWFAAQCLKDAAMAESIFHALGEAGEAAPLVVHLCGRFHSDAGLGTAEQLARLRPDLQFGLVTMVEAKALTTIPEPVPRGEAEWVVVVRPAPKK